MNSPYLINNRLTKRFENSEAKHLEFEASDRRMLKSELWAVSRWTSKGLILWGRAVTLKGTCAVLRFLSESMYRAPAGNGVVVQESHAHRSQSIAASRWIQGSYRACSVKLQCCSDVDGRLPTVDWAEMFKVF